jgi:serine/threonine protein kinase
MAPDRQWPDENSQHQPVGADEQLLQPGDFVAEKLRVLGFLGSGGMSHVYKCEDISLSRVVAVKTLRTGFTEDSLRRLQTEGKAIAALDHPNIVKLYGLRVGANSVPVLTMEFVDGISLASLLEKEGALSVSRSLRIALQIAEALTVAQRKDIIHRDLKPSNIMILNAGALDEKVKILDFGIAKIQNDLSIQATRTGDVFGTPQYMSPEQALGKKVDGRTDQYSLGCVLFEMLCGHPPFEQDNMVLMLIAHAQVQVPPLSKSMKEAPSKKLEAVVSKLLQKDPENRYDLMYDVSQAIFHATTASGAAPGRMIGIALALVAIVAAVFVFNIRGTENKVMSGQSLVDKSAATQKVPTRAPSSEAAVELGLSVPAKLASSNELSRVDQIILSNLSEYLHKDNLTIEGKDITDAGLKRMGRINGLTKISVRKCHDITAAGVASIAHLPLTSLNVEDTNVKDDVAEILCTMPTLEELILTETEVTTKTCAQIVCLPALKVLKLRETKIDASALPYLAKMKHLIDLDLAKCTLKGGISALKYSSSVEELNLSHVHLLPVDFEGISQMSNLRVLYVDDTGMSGSDLKTLSQLKRLNRITISACPTLAAADIVDFHKVLPICLIEQDKVDVSKILCTVKSSELEGPELIKNGDFEEGKTPARSQTCAVGSTDIPHWKIIMGSVNRINKSQLTPGSGINSIELNGKHTGAIQQRIATIPGRKYCLRVKVSPSRTENSEPQKISISIDHHENIYKLPPPLNPSMPVSWNEYVCCFLALNKETSIHFWPIAASEHGPCIDAVSVKLMRK